MITDADSRFGVIVEPGSCPAGPVGRLNEGRLADADEPDESVDRRSRACDISPNAIL